MQGGHADDDVDWGLPPNGNSRYASLTDKRIEANLEQHIWECTSNVVSHNVTLLTPLHAFLCILNRSDVSLNIQCWLTG